MGPHGRPLIPPEISTVEPPLRYKQDTNAPRMDSNLKPVLGINDEDELIGMLRE